MLIRPAVSADASRLAEILIFAKRAAYRPIFHADNVSFGEMQVLPLALAYRDDPARLRGVRVLEDGFVKGMAHGATCPPRAELVELYVDPFFQGAGIGGALLADFEAQARASGATEAFLWVLEKNAAARRFYEAHGYAPSGERVAEEGTPEFLLRYARALTRADACDR